MRRIISLFLFCLMVVPASANVIAPIGDGYTKSTDPTGHFSTENKIWLKKTDTIEHFGYLQFDLSAYGAKLASNELFKITLELMPFRVFAHGDLEIHLMTTGFTEANLTHTSRPTETIMKLATIPINFDPLQKHISIDITHGRRHFLTNHGSGNYQYVILLKPTNGLEAYFYARHEGNQALAPAIEITMMGEGIFIDESRIGAIETKNTAQDSSLTSFGGSIGTNTTSIFNIKTKNSSQDTSITTNTSKNVVQDERLTAFESVEIFYIRSRMHPFKNSDGRYTTDPNGVVIESPSYKIFGANLYSDTLPDGTIDPTLVVKIGGTRITKLFNETVNNVQSLMVAWPSNLSDGTHRISVENSSGKTSSYKTKTDNLKILVESIRRRVVNNEAGINGNSNSIRVSNTKQSKIEGRTSAIESTISGIETKIASIESALLISDIPSKTVLMLTGSVTTFPTGYQACDGTAQTPNLKNHFVAGAGDLYAQDSHGGRDVIAGHGLSVNEMPSHTHSYRAGGFSNQNVKLNNDVNVVQGLGNRTTGSKGSGRTHTHGDNKPVYHALTFACLTADFEG